MSLEEKLLKIKSPNLQSQQHTAVVLSSIEETLSEQKTKFTPTAYFAALLALLKQSPSGASQDNNNDILASTVYLLDLVTSYVSASLLRTQFNTIISLLAPSLSPSTANASLLRSAIGCLESLLAAQDSAAWKLPQTEASPRQAVLVLLTLAIDPRPKIRKRAGEALTKVLKNPPPGPAIDHPAAELCAVAAQNNLKNAVESADQTKRQKGRADDSNEPAVIHALQLTKLVAVASGGWPSKKIESLCELLLAISRSRNDFLVVGAFEVFEVIFDGMQDEVSSSKLPRLLDAIIALKPAQNDSQLIPPWIAIVSRGFGAAAAVEPEDMFARLPELFDMIAAFLTSPAHNIRISASECLISFFANCGPGSRLSNPSRHEGELMDQIAQKALGLLAVRYQTAWLEVFNVLTALFDSLRWRGDLSILPIVGAIGELRSNEAFQGKKEADEVLGHAIRNLGPGTVLSILPHNLIKPKPGQPGRAWLLPLLRDYVSNTELAHFKSEMVPLSEAMYQRILDHGNAEKTVDIKIFETIVQQIWATFPGYCDLPVDLESAVDQPFAEMVSNLLYQQTDLRVDICRGLQNLVESNQALLASDLNHDEMFSERGMNKGDAESNIQHLAALANNLLAVLFNVYSQTLPQSRAYILQCINAYLSITPEKDLIDTFERVSTMLEDALPRPDQPAPKKEPSQASTTKLPPTSHTLLDLVIALSVHLPRSTFASLFSISSNILTNPAILKSDPQLIKKAYKLIPRLSTSAIGVEALTSRNAELQSLILRTSEMTPVPARRDRIIAIQTLISFLPLSDLHFIPSILSEVVLACKDSNERARTAGFDLLIAVTNKISDPANPSGTVIRNSLVAHMPDDSPDAPATLEEVFTMVSAGLAGVAPHMVAASIISLSRLLWEYHARLGDQTKEELVDTVTMFLQSNNREIVRAVLGFVKVMVVVLPVPMLEPRMPSIVPGLMVWSKENKGRLRAKVKGILDRCMRRFDSSKVESWVGGDDRKMVVNIRKRRERAQKKNKKRDDGDEEAEADEGRERYDNEFDEAVYGSEDDDSEIEGGDYQSDDDDDTMANGVSFKKIKGKSRSQQFIRQDDEDDEPLDLLDPKSMANISSKKLGRLRDGQPGSRKTKAKFNEDGKLVLGGDNDDDDDDIDMANTDGQGQDTSINAYLDAVSGVDAVRRGQKGRLKVKSGMQKKAKQETRDRDGEMDLDVDEAREVARKIMQGSGGSPRSPGAGSARNDPKHQRRGLGVEKKKMTSKGPPSTQKQKFRGGHGVGKRGRGSSHARR